MASLSASEIQDQLKSLKEAARSRSPGELGRVDQVGKHLIPQDTGSLSYSVLTPIFQVCQEFMDLKIPRHAEILDVAAGSGILSAELQTGGSYSFNLSCFKYQPGCRYYNIDALDSDLPTLQNLQALRLYRNYVCRCMP